MTFQVRIQNLGKLANATVRVGDLTVLAGVNNTGKSFFSRALYSVLSTMNENLVVSGFYGRLGLLLKPWGELSHLLGAELRLPHLDDMTHAIARMLNSAIFVQERGVVSNNKPLPGLEQAVVETESAFALLKPELENWISEQDSSSPLSPNANILAQIAVGIHAMRQVSGMSQYEFSIEGLHQKLPEAFKGNFQVPRLSNLEGDNGRGIDVHIGDAASFTILPTGAIMAKGIVGGLRFPQVIYLDSPAFWRAQIALKNARRIRMTVASNGREEVDGVPKYFHDLEDMLDRGELSGEVAFPQVVEHVAESIGGKIVRDDSGKLLFREGGETFSLSSTATGVANLGILALLIEKKLVDKGTFLFIDEPESNLHPEWQVAMTEALWELAQGGVNVVIATHSVDILKRLEIYAEEEDTKEDAKNLIAVNHFRRDGTVQSGGVEKIVDVQEDLSAPFFELYKRGL